MLRRLWCCLQLVLNLEKPCCGSLYCLVQVRFEAEEAVGAVLALEALGVADQAEVVLVEAGRGSE